MLKATRLSGKDLQLAREQFSMNEVFREEGLLLGDPYLERLLNRPEFWAIAVCEGKAVVGGLTAHALPMTKSESSEISIYDIAVSAEHPRKGVGRLLVETLRESAKLAGIPTVFVPADVEDLHALYFYRALGGQESEVAFFTFG